MRKIYNLQFTIYKFRGFTLVELLVVMGILAIFGTLTVTIFSRTLKGSNKTQIVGVIKQNGQAVLEILDKTVRDADSVVCTNTTTNKTIVVDKGGIYTRHRFYDPSPPTANGSIKQDMPVKKIVSGTIPPRMETDAEFINRACQDTDPPTAEDTLLTDTNLQAGVSVENGSFLRIKTPGFKDQIVINFNLRPGLQAPQSVVGQIEVINFKTTIQLR